MFVPDPALTARAVGLIGAFLLVSIVPSRQPEGLVLGSTVTSSAEPRVNAGAALFDGPVAGEIDIHSLGVKGDGATVDSAVIQSALTRNPQGKFYFPPGNYRLNNANRQPGVLARNFSGSLRFAQGAVLTCTSVAQGSGDCVGFVCGTGLILDGLEVAYAQPTPKRRNAAAGSGMALHTVSVTGAHISNIRIKGSPGVGVLDERDVDCVFTNIAIKNTTADGFSSVNSKNTHLSNLTTDRTGDDGLSVINYAKQPDNSGFVATNVKVSRSAARGITVPGQSDVQISNFSVDQTCDQGVLIVTDTHYGTRTPTNVRISQGQISGAGRYSSQFNPCDQKLGMGLQYSGVGSIYLDHIKITDSVGTAVVGNTGADGPGAVSASLSDIVIAGAQSSGPAPKVGGVTIYKTQHLQLSKVSIENASGGFFVSGNDEVKATDLSAKNVKGFLNRSYDFEHNGKVEGNRLVTVDDQDKPTGNEFVDYQNKTPSSYKGVEGHVANSNFKVKKDPASTVEGPAPK